MAAGSRPPPHQVRAADAGLPAADTPAVAGDGTVLAASITHSATPSATGSVTTRSRPRSALASPRCRRRSQSRARSPSLGGSERQPGIVRAGLAKARRGTDRYVPEVRSAVLKVHGLVARWPSADEHLPGGTGRPEPGTRGGRLGGVRQRDGIEPTTPSTRPRSGTSRTPRQRPTPCSAS